jgi:hypothetical protein
VDIFTSFVVNVPLKTKEASEVVKAVWSVFCILGIPKTIQTDNGSEFSNEIINLLLKTLKSNHITNVPHHHEANGKVENQIKTVSIVIKKLLAVHGGEWKALLPAATLYINAKIKEKTGVTPFTLMFNRPTTLFDDYDDKQEVDAPDEFPADDEVDAWKLHQKKVYDLVYPAMGDRIAIKQAHDAELFNKLHYVKSIYKPLSVGTVVYIYDHERKLKREPPFVGPYKVKTVDGNHYTLEDVVGGLYHRIVIREELKGF